MALELRERFGATVRFVGSEKGIEREAVPRAGFEVDLLPIGGLMGTGPRGWLRALWQIPRTVLAALGILARHRPDLIVGVGGYAAFPALAAAVLTRRPIVLLEQNAEPGLVTRVFSRFARRICVSFPETLEKVGTGGLLTGNPIRWRGASQGERPPEQDRFRILVFGGSGGARRLNEVVPGAIARLAGGVEVVHQTGRRDRGEVASRYAGLGVDAEVAEFIEDMRAAYEACDVVVCRSGATTLAEITALGIAAILVPFPFAAADHQRRNAEAMVEAGAAWMILDRELSESGLAEKLAEIRADPTALVSLRNRARTLGRPEALEAVVGVCLEVSDGATGGKSHSGSPASDA